MALSNTNITNIFYINIKYEREIILPFFIDTFLLIC